MSAGRRGASRLIEIADAATKFVPVEADVVRSFPEVQLAGGAFEGLWGERDRGTWIFQYRGAPGASLAATLRAQLLAAGSRAVDASGPESEFVRVGGGGPPVHLFLREHADGVQVLIVIGRGNRAEKDEFVRRTIDQRWRPLAPPPDAAGTSGRSP